MHLPRTLAALALLLTLGGCVADAKSSFEDNTLKRVSFELSCPRKSLHYTVLREPERAVGCSGASVGVTGCGKKAVYVCIADEQWVNNTGDERAP